MGAALLFCRGNSLGVFKCLPSQMLILLYITNIIVYMFDYRLSRRELIENEAADVSNLPKGTTRGNDLENSY